MKQVVTLAHWIEEAHQTLLDVGIGSQEIDSDLSFLITDLIGINRVAQQWAHEQALSVSQQTILQAALQQRLKRIPVSQILGAWEFWGLTFKVNDSVLTPRADTEVLVEEALKWIATKIKTNPKAPLSLIDVGCGSGCIGLSLAHEIRHAEITLIDLCPQALQVAEFNHLHLQSQQLISNHVKLTQGDLLSEWDPQQPVDLIVSNPPYIRSSDMSSLMPEVRDHEPVLALQGESWDGLGHVRRLAQQASHILMNGGALMLEVGWDQTEQARLILEHCGFRDIWIRKDYGGNPRVVVGIL